MPKKKHISIPKEGRTMESIRSSFDEMRKNDLNWKEGKSFCLVYYPGKDYADKIQEAYNEFFTENALNPTSFPSLRKMEAEVVSMVVSLFNGDSKANGTMTSGGTESILMAVKAARDHYRNKRKITSPEIILPETAHPAFAKACHYFGIEAKWIPVKSDFTADIRLMTKAISENTIMIVGSAPSYPHGVMDDIESLGAIAKKHKLWFHVDACIGGMFLPFIEQRNEITPWDFRVEGVTSISADLHKYGYAAKGASVILYRNRELRKNQFSIFTKWPGGIYGSPGIAGSKPGGSIAAAWTALNLIGKEGYQRMASKTMDVTKYLLSKIGVIKSIQIMGDPKMSIVAFQSQKINLFEVADELNMKGWHFERLQNPTGLHLTLNNIHTKEIADQFLSDLMEAIATVSQPTFRKLTSNIQLSVAKRLIKILPEGVIAKLQKQFSGKSFSTNDRTAAMYGMMGALSGSGDLDEIILDILDKLNSLD